MASSAESANASCSPCRPRLTPIRRCTWSISARIASIGTRPTATPPRRAPLTTSIRRPTTITRRFRTRSRRRSTTSPSLPIPTSGWRSSSARRKALAEWPAQHFNYRAAEVRQMLSMLDDAIADLRASSGGEQFALNFVRVRRAAADSRAAAAGADAAGSDRADAGGGAARAIRRPSGPHC